MTDEEWELTGWRPPAAARLLRDFLNTVEHQVERELLTDPAAAARWLADQGLPAGARPLDAIDLALLVDVREGLRDMLAAHTGEPVDDASRDLLDGVLAELPVRVTFGADGVPALVAHSEPGPGQGIAPAVAALLDAVFRCLTEGAWTRLKVCGRPGCRSAFYDASRNRSGRWCSMSGCGNVVKMRRAHAARQERA